MNRLVAGLTAAAQLLSETERTPSADSVALIGLGNSLFLTIQYPEDASRLLALLKTSKVVADADEQAVVAAFADLRITDHWIESARSILTTLWRARGPEPRSTFPTCDLEVLFAVAAGIIVATHYPDKRDELEFRWDDLSSEDRYLLARLCEWRATNWQPEAPPFGEFAAGFYEKNSKERLVLVGAIRDAMWARRGLSDLWDLTYWCEAGWRAGQKLAEEAPQLCLELAAENSPDGFKRYHGMYRATVLATANIEGTPSPEKAAVRYFETLAGDPYATIFRRGSQKRYIARAAFDFTYWMALVSKQPDAPAPVAPEEQAFAGPSPGIDYDFRPASYWQDSDPLTAILRNVKGENRRQMIKDYWAAGKLEELDPTLLRDEADDECRQRLGQIHPSFMGGEYLPAYLPGEVEVARIVLQSTTSDVISLRARPIPAGIAYRVVDEYEATFILPIPTSKSPLTLAELIRQLDCGAIEGADTSTGGGLSTSYNDYNLDGGCSPEELRYFTNISSSFYAELEDHYERVFEDWVEERVAERDRDNEEET